MKKRLLTWLVGLASLATFGGAVACDVGSGEEATYTVNTDAFDSVVEYGGTIDTADIVLVAGTKRINVTPDMIVGSDGTDSVGTHVLIIGYNGQTFTVPYIVKYKVEFKVNAEVVDTQYVLSASEIVAPTEPVLDGYVFTGWTPETSTALTDNAVFEATFTLAQKDIPVLETLKAEYGDTLADLALPQNALGKWEFVDALTTDVGLVGQNVFDVRFVPTDTSLQSVTGTVTVNVAKKKLDFTNVVTNFVYNGQEQFPTYALSEDAEVVTIGQAETDAGEYSFTLLIDDPNYEGSYQGTYTIEKATVAIEVEDCTISYGQNISLSEISYTVTGLDESLLNLEIVKPANMRVGEYDLLVKVNNENVVADVKPGKLTVTKGKINPPDPTVVSTATFGDPLSTVSLSEHPNGVWNWKNSDVIISTPNTFEAQVVFTPNAASDYETEERTITIKNILKKELTITVLNSEFVYDGEEHSVEYQIGDGSYTDVEVKGVPTATNAGSVSGTIEIDDQRYQGSVSATLVIQKADLENVSFDAVYNVEWEPYLTLGKVTLANGYSWKAIDTELEVGNDQKYAAVYTPADSLNYNSVEGELTVNVEKRTASIGGVKDSYSFDYNGSEHTIANVTGSHEESEVTFAYKFGDTTVDSIVNAGTYTVTITLPESEHYKQAKATVTAIVAKADIDATIADMTATYEDTLGSLTLPANEYGVWSWQASGETLVGAVGAQTHTAVFTATNTNYNDTTADVTVRVAKKALTITVTMNEYTYDGTDKSVAYVIADANGKTYEGLTVKGNTAYTNADNYSITLTIDEANYEGKTTTTLVILKALVIPTLPANLTATYGGTLASVSLPANWSWVEGGVSVGSAGTQNFAAKYTYPEAEGVDNYEDYTTELTVTVAKAKVELPTVDSKVYTGETLTAEIPTRGMFTVSENSYVNAGNHNVKLTLSDSANYQWANGDEGVTYVTFTITQATTTLTVSIDGWTYDEDANVPTYTSNVPVTGVTYSYSTAVDGEYTAEVPTNAGAYYVKANVAVSNNYTAAESEAVAFEIEKATPATDFNKTYTATWSSTLKLSDITGLPSGYAWKNADTSLEVGAGQKFAVVYTPTDTTNYEVVEGEFTVNVGKASASVTANETYTTTYNGNAYTITSGIETSHTESEVTFAYKLGETTVNAMVTAGTYTVTITLPESEHYLAAVTTTTVVIEKATPTTDFNKTYNATWSSTLKLSDITGLPSGYAWKNADTSLEVGNNQKFAVVFTPTDTANYVSVEGEFTVNVGKASASVTANATYTSTYNGNAYTITSGIVTSHNESEVTFAYKIGETTVDSIVNAGTYTVTITLPESAHYQAATTTATVEIGRAQYEATLPTNLTAMYGDTLASVSLPENWSWLGDTAVLVGNAGEQKFTAKYVHVEAEGVDNYVDEYEYELTINVGKKAVAEPTVDSQDYTGSELTAMVEETTLYYGAEIKGTNVGTYTVTLELVNSANYAWANDGKVTFTITQATTTLTVSIDGWTYGQDAKTPSYTSNVPVTGVTYSYSTAVDGEYTAEVPTNAGTYYVKASVAAATNNNYTAAEDTKEFKIAKLIVDVPEIAAKQHTGGSNTVLKADIEDTEYYTVEENNGGTEKGEYDVVLKLTNENYMWSNGSEEATITLKFEISNNLNSWTQEPAIAGWTFGEVGNTGSAVAEFGTSTLTIEYRKDGETTYTSSLPTDAGSYFARFSVAATDEYNGLSKEIGFTIAKKSVAEPTVASQVYTGDELTATVAETDDYYGATIKGTNVGTYTVTLTLKDSANYVWANDGKVSFAITQATTEFTNVSLAGWIYNQTPSVATYESNVPVTGVYYTYCDTIDGEYTRTQPTTAGTYYVKANVAATANYTAAESEAVSFTIEKAMPTTNFNKTYNATWSSALKLSDITGLPNGYAWKNADTSLEVGAGQKFAVVYTPSDTTNYKIVEGEFTVNVSKATATVTANERYTSTYNASAYTITSGIVTSHNESEVTFAYKLGETTVDSIVNAGTYTVVITLPESEHYQAATTTATVVIEKADITQTIGDMTATYEDTLGSLTLPTNEYGEWSWKTGAATVVGNAGTQTHIAVFTATNANYNDTTQAVTISVAKKNLTINVTANEYTYDGTAKSVAYTITGYEDLTVVGNTAYTNAGSYSITLTIDEANYAGETTTTLLIKKASYTPTLPTGLTATYGDTLSDVSLPDAEKGVWNWVDDTAAVGNAGAQTHAAIFTYTEESGVDNYEDYTTNLTVTVGKQAVEVPTVASQTYTGSELTATVAETDAYYGATITGTTVGTYTATLTLKDTANYTWKSGNTASFSITKATPVVTVSLQGWTYGQSANTPTYNCTNVAIANVYYTYSTSADGTFTTTVPSTAGTYYVKANVESTGNYNAAESTAVAFTIEKAKVTVPTLASKTYTSGTLTADVPTSTQYTVTANAGGVNAGEYDVTLTLTNSTNYKWSNGDEGSTTVKFTITKATPTVSGLSIYGWTYGQTASEPTATTNGGAITYLYYDASGTKLSAKPTNAGTYSVKASVAESANYTAYLSAGVTFTIDKATVTVPANANKTYSGSSWLSSLDDADGRYTASSANDCTNAGAHSVTLTLKNTNNYQWSSGSGATVTITLNIAKADLVTVSKPTIENWTYGEAAKAPSSTAYNGADVISATITYTYSTSESGPFTATVPSNAGTYYVMASIAETANYNGATSMPTVFNIAKATPTLTLPNGTYYENMVGDAMKASVPGTFAFTAEFGVGTSETVSRTFDVTFTPTDTTNYASVTQSATVTLKSPVYIGSNYYGTVEKALTAATSGEVWIIPDVNGIYIKSNATIKSGVTLRVPFSRGVSRMYEYATFNKEGGFFGFGGSWVDKKGVWTTHSTDSSKYPDAYNFHMNRKDYTLATKLNTLILAEGVTLTNSGTLEIAGQLSGANGGARYAGHTAGKYAEIVLEKGAKIVNTGAINCYGFIRESSLNNGSEVQINGGTLGQPFVLRDFRGGSFMYAAKGKDITAFNQFEMPNVEPLVTIGYSGSLKGYASLNASSSVHTTTIDLAGSASSNLIQFTNSASYLTAKYDKSTSICKLDLYGGAKTNKMSLSVAGTTVTTESVHFPLTWRYNVSLHQAAGQTAVAEYTMGQKYKMMPGHVFTVDENVKVTVNELIIYSSYVDECMVGNNGASNTNTTYGLDHPNYVAGTSLPGAKLIVNGTLVATTLGGKVYTERDTASLTVNTTVGLKVTEIITVNGSSFAASLGDSKEVSESAVTLVYGSNQVTAAAGTTYTSTSGKWA
ncbi:MAG: hypothetical protein IJV85_03745 [Clostridia bacterium]|nr:hypothetical protein [Clostridia bacterium]